MVNMLVVSEGQKNILLPQIASMGLYAGACICGFVWQISV